jgi:predicted Zn-dependent protease
MSSRLEQIRAMLAEQPDDPFLRYSLAMELRKAQQHEAALHEFQALMQMQPPYVPAFHMAGQMLVELGRDAQARDVLARGIAASHAQRNAHAADEMQALLDSLG